MTQVNLRRGLEVWYELDTRNFDSERDVLHDRSGYGRSAQAEGGPTVGVAGPGGFEATSFDGDDDHLNAPFGGEIEFEQLTVFVIGQVAGGAFASFEAQDGEMVFQPGDGRGVGFWGDTDNGSQTSADFDSVENGDWISGHVRYDYVENSETVNLGVNGQFDDYDSDDFGSDGAPAPNSLTIARRYNDDSFYLDGNIALVGVWNRLLNDSEIRYLHALSGPRRTML